MFDSGAALTLRAVTEPLRILIFGQSNTRGVQLAAGEVTWTDLVAAALPEVLGRPVEITVRPFFAHAPGSEEYLARELDKRQPDVAFLMVTTFSFATVVIEPGVRGRFGERAGNAYQFVASRFDGWTRARGRAGSAINTSARAVALRFLPAAPVTNYETALEGTQAALKLLARQEHVQTVAMHGFVKLPRRHRGRPSRKEEVVERFLAAVGAQAAELRVPFINLQHEEIPESWYLPDGLHVSAEAHRGIAAAVLAAFRDGRIRV